MHDCEDQTQYAFIYADILLLHHTRANRYCRSFFVSPHCALCAPPISARPLLFRAVLMRTQSIVCDAFGRMYAHAQPHASLARRAFTSFCICYLLCLSASSRVALTFRSAVCFSPRPISLSLSRTRKHRPGPFSSRPPISGGGTTCRHSPRPPAISAHTVRPLAPPRPPRNAAFRR